MIFGSNQITGAHNLGRRLFRSRGVAAGDWWNPDGSIACAWAAYQPKGAANFAASLVDLTGNGNNAIDPGGALTPGWDAVNGWRFNNDELQTTFVPQNDQSQSVLIQFTNVANTGVMFGLRDSVTLQWFWASPNNAGIRISYANGGLSNVAPQLLAGNVGVSGNQGYRNGAADGGAIGAWGAGVPVQPAYIGCYNNQGAGGASRIIADIQALALYDCTLTGPQMLAVATAMAAL